MIIDPSLLSKKENYKLLAGLVVPRPIAWISTVSKKGIYNLAPYSYFNVVSTVPPCIMFCSDNPEGSTKDTLQNILDTQAFVVNMVSVDLMNPMLISAKPYDKEVDEFFEAGVTPILDLDSLTPRVKESSMSLYCIPVHKWSHPDAEANGTTMIIGEVKKMYIEDEIISSEFKVDFDTYRALGRLAGRAYCSTVPTIIG